MRIPVLIFIACLLRPAAPAVGQTVPESRGTLAVFSGAIESVAQLVDPAVVQIFTTRYTAGEGLVPRSSDLLTTRRASGSGVIVDPNGYVVTNAHVVRDAWRIRVEIPAVPEGRSLLATRSRMVGAELVGLDEETDIAVLRIDAQNLPALPFGDSDDLKSGQLVLAFGSPLGLRNSVSLGVVSAVARQLEPESPMVYVQTDASLNPGNSGGPLVDVRGQFVGLNTLLLSHSGGNEGLGFAAPSNIVRRVFEQIRQHGRVRRGEIGVRVQTVTPVLAAGWGLARDHGAVLADVVPGSPAAVAGLKIGDLVLALDGKPMDNGRQLHVNLYLRAAGAVVVLDVLRDGQASQIRVTMTERVDFATGLPFLRDGREHVVTRLGILGVGLDSRIAAMLPPLRGRAGVVVISTVAGAIDSREGGFAPGDVIYAVNRRSVGGLSELRAMIEAVHEGEPVVVLLERRGAMMLLAFTLD